VIRLRHQPLYSYGSSPQYQLVVRLSKSKKHVLKDKSGVSFSEETISHFPVVYLMPDHFSDRVITALNNRTLNNRILCGLKTKSLAICHISCRSLLTRKLSCNFVRHWKIFLDQGIFTYFVLEDQQIIKRKVALSKSHVMKKIKNMEVWLLAFLIWERDGDYGCTTSVARCPVRRGLHRLHQKENL
jgi:hypothetical protein